jgi:hypothetical protein
MALLMFYSLACLSFLGYRSHGFRLLLIYFSIDYYRFRNYRNISVVFISENIVSILFFRKKNMKMKVIWPPIDRFRQFSSLVVIDFPLGDILRNRDTIGCISKWAVELGALNIDFSP